MMILAERLMDTTWRKTFIGAANVWWNQYQAQLKTLKYFTYILVKKYDFILADTTAAAT